MEHDDFNKILESRKFHWINFGLVGMGASIAILTQLKGNFFIFLSMIMFGILVIFEAIGLWIVESNIALLSSNKWYVTLWFHQSTLLDIILLVVAMSFLGLGTYI